MVFAQKFEFSSQNLSISIFKNLIFQPSEARLSSITQNWNKSLSFHNCVPKGLTNFECPIWKLHTLNYHTRRPMVKMHISAVHEGKKSFNCDYCGHSKEILQSVYSAQKKRGYKYMYCSISCRNFGKWAVAKISQPLSVSVS